MHLCDYFTALCNFVPVVFFLLCGFFLLPKVSARHGKLVRGVKRSGITFGVLTTVTVLLNAATIVFLVLFGANVSLKYLLAKRLWFNFIVLSQWKLFSVGSGIWFVHCLFYACLALLILNRLKILRYVKIPLLLAGVAGVVLGEFAGVIHFDFFGYDCIPANAFTYALPLMLLGALIRERFSFFTRIPPILYWIVILGGGVFSLGELALLDRLGAVREPRILIGFLVTALGLVGWALVHPKAGPGFLARHGRHYAFRIYVLSQPLYLVVMNAVSLFPNLLYLVLRSLDQGTLAFLQSHASFLFTLLRIDIAGFLQSYACIFFFLLSFVVAMVYGIIKDLIRFSITRKKADAAAEAPKEDPKEGLL